MQIIETTLQVFIEKISEVLCILSRFGKKQEFIINAIPQCENLFKINLSLERSKYLQNFPVVY